jgi:YgiT-type zinc finger domain-containing protein
MQEMRPCPKCGGQMTFKTKVERLMYKGHVKTIESKGWWCGTCGDGVLNGDALKASEEAFAECKAKVGKMDSGDLG